MPAMCQQGCQKGDSGGASVRKKKPGEHIRVANLACGQCTGTGRACGYGGRVPGYGGVWYLVGYWVVYHGVYLAGTTAGTPLL